MSQLETETTAAAETKRQPVKAPAPVAKVEEAPKPRRAFTAAETRFATSAEFTSPLASYVPEIGTPAEDLLRPEYWANIKSLKPRVRIWIEEEGGAYVGELYVLKTGQGFAKVCWMPGWPFTLPGAGADPIAPDGYAIEFRGHIVKHRIVRLNDGHVLKQGLDTPEEAAAWLRDHKRMLAA